MVPPLVCLKGFFWKDVEVSLWEMLLVPWWVSLKRMVRNDFLRFCCGVGFGCPVCLFEMDLVEGCCGFFVGDIGTFLRFFQTAFVEDLVEGF